MLSEEGSTNSAESNSTPESRVSFSFTVLFTELNYFSHSCHLSHTMTANHSDGLIVPFIHVSDDTKFPCSVSKALDKTASQSLWIIALFTAGNLNLKIISFFAINP